MPDDDDAKEDVFLLQSPTFGEDGEANETAFRDLGITPPRQTTWTKTRTNQWALVQSVPGNLVRLHARSRMSGLRKSPWLKFRSYAFSEMVQ